MNYYKSIPSNSDYNSLYERLSNKCSLRKYRAAKNPFSATSKFLRCDSSFQRNEICE